MKTTKNN